MVRNGEYPSLDPELARDIPPECRVVQTSSLEPGPLYRQFTGMKSAAAIPVATLADRIRHVVQSAFNGRRIVIFSGGSAKGEDAVLEEIRGIHEGGGFGSIVGRNSFQRTLDEGAALLNKIQDIYLS